VIFLPTAFLRHDSTSTHEITHGRRRSRFLPRAAAPALLRRGAIGSIPRRVPPPEGGRLRLLLRPAVAVPPLGEPASVRRVPDPAPNAVAARGSSEGDLRLLPRR
jgi:hypothetical protein